MLVQPLSIHKVPTFAEQFRAAAPSLVKALATLRLKESKLSMKTTPWPRKKSEGFRISMSKLDMRMSRNKKQHMWIYSKQQQWGFHQKTGVATDVSPPIWSLDWLKLLHLWKFKSTCHVCWWNHFNHWTSIHLVIAKLIHFDQLSFLGSHHWHSRFHCYIPIHIPPLPEKIRSNHWTSSQIHWLIIVFPC